MGNVYWITGLPGAGKSTIGGILVQRLKQELRPVVFLDGDTLRETLGIVGQYTYDERRKIAGTYSRLCRMLSNQGLDVVIATVSMFHECHQWNRKHLSNYYEIYIRLPMEIIKKRNQKNLFSKGAKNVVGLDIPLEEPLDPDIIIENTGERSPEEEVDRIINTLMEKTL